MSLSKQLYANNASTTIAANIGSTDTSISVANGSSFPSPGTGQYFMATIDYSGVREVIKVLSVSGNTFTSVVRGQEGTTAQTWPLGAVIENRATAGTLGSYARLVDRFDEVASVDLLSIPVNSNSNTYICHSNDDSGNPVIALRNTDSLWNFTTHNLVLVTGTIATVNSFGLTSTAIGTKIPSVATGQYIMQITSGASIGACREITGAATNTIGWLTSLIVTPSTGDTFQIYQSNSSAVNALIAAGSVVTHDATKANVVNGTMTGNINMNGIMTVLNELDVKSTFTASTSSTTVDLSTANVFKITIAATTTFTFINAPSGTSNVFSFTLILVNDGTAGRAVSFPSSVKWAGGILPPRSTAAGAVDIWTFFTDDSGVTFFGSLAIIAAA